MDFRPLRLVFSLPGMERTVRERDLIYKSLPSTDVLMDIYRPPDASAAALPAVIFVHGDGPPDWLKDIKDWGQYESWGQVVAASGLVGVTFNHRSTEGFTRVAEAAADVDDLVKTVLAGAGRYGIDSKRIAVWACSAGGYLGAKAAFDYRPAVRCLVLYYALMEPIAPSGSGLPDYSAQARMDADGPALFIARAGLDRPQLNEILDRFTARARSVGLDTEVHNHARGRHAFDVLDPGLRSSLIIARTIEFLKSQLRGSLP